MTTYRRYAGGHSTKSSPATKEYGRFGRTSPQPLKSAGLLEIQCVIACAGVLLLLLVRLAGGGLLENARSVCAVLMEDNINFQTYKITEKIASVYHSLTGKERDKKDSVDAASDQTSSITTEQNPAAASQSTTPDFEEDATGSISEDLTGNREAASVEVKDNLTASAGVSISRLALSPQTATTAGGDILPTSLLTSTTLSKADSYAEMALGGLLEAPAECSFEAYFPAMPLKLPVNGKVTSPFGYRYHPVTGQFGFHTGMDLSGNLKDPIYAAGEGTVVETGKSSVWGNYIVIDHGKNTQTFYAHCYKLSKKKGAKVKQGEKIALLGSTGLSTGPHVHFEVRINGLYMDPAWLTANKQGA